MVVVVEVVMVSVVVVGLVVVVVEQALHWGRTESLN